LSPDGSVQRQRDFLALAEVAVPAAAWGWTTAGIGAAGVVAAATAVTLAAGFVAAHQQRIERDTVVARAWLERRTLELCGALTPGIDDLFDAAPPVGQWRCCPVADQRLAGFAADPAVPVPQRREALALLSRFRSITAAQPDLPAVTVRALGLLMLCP
jgi:hypothetical protein